MKIALAILQIPYATKQKSWQLIYFSKQSRIYSISDIMKHFLHEDWVKMSQYLGLIMHMQKNLILQYTNVLKFQTLYFGLSFAFYAVIF